MDKICCMSQWRNQLHYGDNLDVLKNEIQDESIDLIYLDPPFNSKATYNVLFKDKTDDKSSAQIEAFGDTWHWDKATPRIFRELIMNQRYPKLANLMNTLEDFLGHNDMMAYLVMMAIRLVELHRVLKPTGSIYLHCDPTASHYLKLLLDAVFGFKNFQNEIIWWYHDPSGFTKNRFMRKHDVILFYSKDTSMSYFNIDEIRTPYKKGTLRQSELGHRSFGRITKTNPIGRAPEDVFEIPILNSQAKERMGYPTQKPETLLEKIILASSNKGDVVLDPFCGCGTTVSVAEKLGRRWIGIDITHLAVSLIEKRLKDSYGKDLKPYDVHGIPTNMPAAIDLAERSKYQFEWWAFSLVGGRPDKKMGKDEGIDGILYFLDEESGKHKEVVIQVKAGKVSSPQIRDLRGVISDRKYAEIGVFITLKKPTRDMIKSASDAGVYEAENGKLYDRIQILTIEEIFAGKQPDYPFRDTGGISPFKKAERHRDDEETNNLYE